MAGRQSWWGAKVRQTRAHLKASVGPIERRELAAWTTPDQRRLFAAMHVADQRHGLDVVASLRRQGVAEPDVLLAGLLHDAGKGDTGLLPRVAWSLGERYGPWIRRVAGLVPGWRAALDRLTNHAELSAGLAAAAGCTDRTTDLIRNQAAPRDPGFGEQLRLADEAN